MRIDALLVPRTGPGSITVKAQPGNEIGISSPGPAGSDDALIRYQTISSGDTVTFVNVPDGTYSVYSRDGVTGPQPEPQTVQVCGGPVSGDRQSVALDR